MSPQRPPGTPQTAGPPTPAPVQVPQYAYGWLVYVAGAVVAIIAAVAIYKLNYTYGQAPHRIIKMAVAVGLFGLVIVKPRVALYAWVLSLPITGWLPVTGVTGLNGANVLFLILLMTWILPAVMAKRKIFADTPLRWPIAAYIALLVLSGVRTAVFPPAAYEGRGLEVMFDLWQRLPAIAVYFVVANIAMTERQVRNLLVALPVAAAALGVISARQFADIDPARRIRGGMNSNELGAYFAVCATMLFSQVLWSRAYRFLQRIVIWLGAALATVGVFLTKSRGAYVAVVPSFGFLSYFVGKKALVVFILVVATSPLWAPDFVKERVSETTVDSVEAALVGDITDRLDPTAGVRLQVWRVVLEAFPRSPLVGFGHGSVPLLTGPKLRRPFSAHSLYFETMSDSGLMGLGVLLWLLVACFRSGRKLLRLAATPLDRGLAVGFLAVTIAIVVTNAFGQRFAHRAITGTFFLIAGLVDQRIRIAREALASKA
jgi:O-antigen ligase